MKTIIIIIYFSLAVSSFSQFREWVKTYNGSGNSTDEANFIAADPQGNILVCGQTVTTGSNYDICIIKYSPSGTQLWTAVYNGTSNSYDEPAGLAVDNSGNVYVTGKTLGGGNYDAVTVKYNSAGVLQWVQTWGGAGNSEDEASSVFADNLGNVYITGNTVTSGQGYNYITVKYNSAGVLQWAKQYNNPVNSGDYASFIAGDANNVYVTGTSVGAGTGSDFLTIKYNSNGDSLWTARYSGTTSINEIPYGFAVDAGGNVYVTGMTQGSGSGIDYMTIKYNTNGVVQWQSRYTAPGNTQDIPEGLTIDGSGNVYVTGRTRVNSSYNDFGTVKYNSSGAQQWVAIYDNIPVSRDDYGYDIAVDAAGNVYVTGNSQADGSDRDALTIKYNSSGTQQWIARYDSTNGEEAYAIVLDANNNVYVTGYHYPSTVDFLTIKYSQVNGITPLSNEIPNAYDLSQNYPNPFNPVTNINFSITKSGHVKLTVFDILGREAAVLVNENLAAGVYKADFNASGLPSGTYFYKLEIEGYTDVKKMMLIK